MIYGWCLGIAAVRTDLWGGIAVMDLLRQDLLLPISDILIVGAHLVYTWCTFVALLWSTIGALFGTHVCSLYTIEMLQYLLHLFILHKEDVYFVLFSTLLEKLNLYFL